MGRDLGVPQRSRHAFPWILGFSIRQIDKVVFHSGGTIDAGTATIAGRAGNRELSSFYMRNETMSMVGEALG
ncbi:MAG TPA: hypothetical protein VN939_15440, partial [Chthoniobacterales bacterium]|nr:hypothetical protein [Chthoniobacterales bacterium]